MNGRERIIIGLAGLIGSGKTTAAHYLIERGFVHLPFARPLKMMLAAFLDMQGVDPRRIIAMLDGNLKEQPADELSGATPRRALQTLGTEWGRELMPATLWVDAWRRSIDRYTCIVTDDVRFMNEVDAIWSLGGRIFRVERPDVSAQSHVSENRCFPVDGVIRNDGSIDDLHAAVTAAVLPYPPVLTPGDGR